MPLYLCKLNDKSLVELGQICEIVVCSSSQSAARRLCESYARRYDKYYKYWTDNKMSSVVDITNHNVTGILTVAYV